MMKIEDRLAAGQIRGDREDQEDEYGILDFRLDEASPFDSILVIVADGMGGHVGGKEASRIAVKTFVDAYQSLDVGPVSDRFRTSLAAANKAIGDAIASDRSLEGMGCTIVAAAIGKAGLEWVSVGDSNLWLLRDGLLRRLNADHSMAPVLDDLVEVGRMTAEEAAADKRRHALRSAVTGEHVSMIDFSSQPLLLCPGDRLILASDGLETLSEKEIAETVLHADNAQTSVDALLSAVSSKSKPGQDNTTVIVYSPIVPSTAISSASIGGNAAAEVRNASSQASLGSNFSRNAEANSGISAAITWGKPTFLSGRAILLLLGLAFLVATAAFLTIWPSNEAENIVKASPSALPGARLPGDVSALGGGSSSVESTMDIPAENAAPSLPSDLTPSISSEKTGEPRISGPSNVDVPGAGLESATPAKDNSETFNPGASEDVSDDKGKADGEVPSTPVQSPP